jgi:S1-C subfamily serine protease
MDWLDLLIIVFVLSAVARGLKAGVLQLLFSALGFVAGLLLGSQLARLIAPHFSGFFIKLIFILVLEFGLALFLAGVGESLSHRVKYHAVRLHLGKVNEVAGGIIEVLFTLAIIWFAASALADVRSYNIGQQVKKSFIIQKLNAALPHPPDFFAQLEKIISPNGFPNVFLGLEPQHTTVSPKNSVNNAMVIAAEKSVVKVQGAGCGGLVFGSGFVAGPGLIVTNAHVVAGIKKPQIVDSKKTYQATTVWFDPNLDIAILRFKNLTDPPLTLSGRVLPDADAVATLGFAGGKLLVVENGAIIDHVTAVGRNIYNQGIINRSVYEVQANIKEGDSGGPLLAPDGTVAGVIFAKAVTQDNIGYALLINQVLPLINQAKQQNAALSTGSCAQD